MEPNDANLVSRWRQGDPLAVSEVMDRYADALGAVAYSVLGDRVLAQDAVQEVFARATARLDTLNGVIRLGPWLLGIVRHAALDFRRKRKREVPLDGHEPQAPATPAADAARAELRERLREAIDRLPEDQRDIFVLKYMAGMSYAEIGRTVGITPEAVGQKLWRIRQKLQADLEEFRP